MLTHDGAVQPTLRAAQPGTKRGLVLEGGGAKAAYAFGCLLALRERGIEFDAVSGTSAGALNAVLWSSTKLEFGTRFWTGITRRKVRRPRVPVIMAPWLVIPQLAAQRYSLDAVHPADGRSAILDTLGRPSTVGIIGTLTALFVVLAEIGKYPADWNDPFLWRFYTVFVAILWLPYVVQSLVRRIPFIGRWMRDRRISVYSTDPLRSVIEECLTGCELRMPTYVCVTQTATAFDPDEPGDRRPRTWHFPKYVEISQLDTNGKVSALMASTALPFGLFPPASLDGRDVSDGGLADNVPVFPLVTPERCDEIVVIRLSPQRNDPGDSYLNDWKRHERAARIQRLDTNTTIAMADALCERFPFAPHVQKPNRPPKIIPLAQPEYWPTRIVTFAPKRPLGLFITGTLRFSRAYTRFLVEMGRRDTNAAVSTHWPDQCANESDHADPT